eukprot:GHVS01042280.1.p1 GENE.GHVS01042280.1~~GHVS01042280.1.p1  ORF type:complete len:191 (-),score=63.98 GHVS01042280.1:84-656(-)
MASSSFSSSPDRSIAVVERVSSLVDTLLSCTASQLTQVAAFQPTPSLFSLTEQNQLSSSRAALKRGGGGGQWPQEKKEEEASKRRKRTRREEDEQDPPSPAVVAPLSSAISASTKTTELSSSSNSSMNSCSQFHAVCVELSRYLHKEVEQMDVFRVFGYGADGLVHMTADNCTHAHMLMELRDQRGGRRR